MSAYWTARADGELEGRSAVGLTTVWRSGRRVSWRGRWGTRRRVCASGLNQIQPEHLWSFSQACHTTPHSARLHFATSVYICVWVCAAEHVQYVFKHFRGSFVWSCVCIYIYIACNYMGASVCKCVFACMSVRTCVRVSFPISQEPEENNGFSLNELKQQGIYIPPPPPNNILLYILELSHHKRLQQKAHVSLVHVVAKLGRLPRH